MIGSWLQLTSLQLANQYFISFVYPAYGPESRPSTETMVSYWTMNMQIKLNIFIFCALHLCDRMESKKKIM